MLKKTLTIVVVLSAVEAGIVAGSPPALASFEGLSNTFYGTNAGSLDDGDTNDNSFFGVAAGGLNTTGGANAFFGKDAGNKNETGGANAFFGKDAGYYNTGGSFNAFFGRSAGQSNTTGSDNAFFGKDAGYGNTTGFNNTFIGRAAGSSNTTGRDNAFVGIAAGQANTTGADNAFFGASAGRGNTTAIRNAFFGAGAGYSTTTACCNALFGYAAGFSNTTGTSNSFFGYGAGHSNNQGSENAFFGTDTGFNNTGGTSNAAVGRSAGGFNTTGNSNSFFGSFTGSSNTTEGNNTFIGSFSNGVAGITNATAVGSSAQVSQSNSLVLGSIKGLNGASSDVKVGIGTATPADPLHVRRTDGTSKVLVEEASATLEGRELFQLTNNGAARFRVRNTSNNATWDFQSSSGAGSFVIDRVGGDPSLDFEMQPDGDLVVRGSVTGTSFISSSDRNLKTDITSAEASKLMGLLRQLDISTWRFKSDPEGTVKLGPMAQDFHRLFGMGTETTIDIRDLAALALVAAQTLDEQNADQQKEIENLKRVVADLSSRVP